MVSLKRTCAAMQDECGQRPSGDNHGDTSSRGLDHELVYQGTLDLALSNKRLRSAAGDAELTMPLPAPASASPSPLSLSPSSMAVDIPSPSSWRSSTDINDWHALKQQHTAAMQVFDGESPLTAAPLLRRVLAECDHFLTVHRDPSVIYAPSLYTPPRTPPRTSDILDGDVDMDYSGGTGLQLELPSAPKGSPTREPIIAFYAIYSAALFAFGSLIARDPKLITLSDVPSAAFYFGRALDVIDYGENHPRRATYRSDADARVENFEMAITYGRTLVYLAAEHNRVDIDTTINSAPLWTADSPFAPGQLPIPPRRLSLASLGSTGMLALAADQFLRAFLHMPHSTFISSSISAAAIRRCHPLFKTCACPAHLSERERPYPRCRTLSSVGHDMLLVAAQLPRAEDRKKWVLWADSNVFNQMSWEPEAAGWESVSRLARGRCRLLAARACLGEVQAGLHGIANATSEVAEGLDHVKKAVEHLSHAVSLPAAHERIQQEARVLLADAHNLLRTTAKSEAAMEAAHHSAFMQLDATQVVAHATRPNTQLPNTLVISASG